MRLFHMSCILWSAILLLGAIELQANTLSYTGILNNPDAIFLQSFDVLGPATISIQTWSYGGGTNANGDIIGAGGFDTYITLFSFDGNFIDDNDDGFCPPGNFDGGNCFDSTLLESVALSGSYTLALTVSPNSSAGANLSDGFSGGGDFLGRNPNYAVDVTIASTATPEPGSSIIVLIGLLLMILRSRQFIARMKSSSRSG